MKLCPNCGMQMADTAKFCANCGTKAPAPQEPAAEPIAQEKSAAPKKHKLLVPIIIAAAVLALAVAAVLIPALGGPKEDAYLGKYTCEAIRSNGVTFEPDLLELDAYYIKLEEKGEGVLRFEEKRDITWKIEDENTLLLSDGDDEMKADWEDGVLEIKLDDVGKLWLVAKGASLPQKVLDDLEIELEPPIIDPPPVDPVVKPDEGPEEEPEMLDGPSMLPSGTPLPVVSENWTDFEVSTVGAERIIDVDGNDTIRFYYDFTNNTDISTCAYLELGYEVTQDGYPLQETYTHEEDEAAEYINDLRMLRPGASIRCVAEYSMKPDGGPVTLTLYNYDNDSETVTADFQPDNLPGYPPQELETPAVTNPEWLADWSDRGTYSEVFDVFIDNAELAEDDAGNSLIRVYFEFTNNSQEATSYWWCAAPVAYQDGIELLDGYPSVSTEEDQNYSVEIEPGESIRVSACYQLISDSPVEIELRDYYNENGGLGAVYELSAE